MYEKFLNYFTDYIFVKDEPQKADVIFVPGNGYPQMAAHRKRRQLLRIPVSSLSSSTIWFPVTDFLQTEALTASVSPETVLLFALTQ